jgi:hypothetical protein
MGAVFEPTLDALGRDRSGRRRKVRTVVTW